MSLKLQRLLKSFSYALQGLIHVVRTQQNFRIHMASSIIVIASGIILSCNYTEWIVLFMVFAMVFATEIINTAIETLVDFISPEFHEKAGLIKDISAGAVLVTSVFAIIIGLLIFLPRLMNALP